MVQRTVSANSLQSRRAMGGAGGVIKDSLFGSIRKRDHGSDKTAQALHNG